MTVDRAVIEQTIREFCVTDDKETAMARIEIWLNVAHREGSVEALRKSAKAWRPGRRSLVAVWLNARADKAAAGERL